jgi:hypothetical protein
MTDRLRRGDAIRADHNVFDGSRSTAIAVPIDGRGRAAPPEDGTTRLADQRSAGKYALISQPQAISTSFGVRHSMEASSATNSHEADMAVAFDQIQS